MAMSYRTILVLLDGRRESGRRLETAIEMACRHEAHLKAISLAVSPSIPSYANHPILLEALVAQQKQTHSDAGAMLNDFSTKAKTAGLSHEGVVVDCRDVEITDVVGLHSRYADLLVIEQQDPDNPGPGGAAMTQHLVLEAGLPVLVIPYIGASRTPGSRVMVAWDAGREAARAVRDALPILVAADHVDVVVIDPAKHTREHGEEPGADIALFLARHDCKVETQHLPAGGLDAGEALLSHLADRDSDLLVMGAYGHARLRQLVLGGVTQTILGEMTVPVMMSR
jgi:nucleotide-binding universal stress UspA family protein